MLQRAARCGDTEIIELLLSASARYGGAAIYEALSGHGSWGQIARIVGSLLKTGASPEPAIKGRCYYHHEYVF